MDEFTGWKFRSFVSERRKSVIHAWYEAQIPQVRARFDTALKYLHDQPIWDMPYTRVLVGECDGLVEIRFKVKNVQHRPLGFYGPLTMEFTIVFFAMERDGKFEPPEACSIGLGRKTIVNGNREKYSREWSVQ